MFCSRVNSNVGVGGGGGGILLYPHRPFVVVKSKVLLKVLYSYFQIQRNVLFFRVRANLVFYLVPKKFPHTRLEKPNVLKENNFIMLTLKTQFFFFLLSYLILLCFFLFVFHLFMLLTKLP